MKKKRSIISKKMLPTVVGTVQMTREGYAFVNVEGEDEDVFIPATKTRGALNGDLVKASIIKEVKHTTKNSRSPKAHRHEG